MLKNLYNLVMAFTANTINANKKEEPSKAPLSNSTPSLTKQEVETLLLMIKEMNFRGEHVEKIYTLVYKLQQYYMSFNQ
jgi:predicted transcriptional regulator